MEIRKNVRGTCAHFLRENPRFVNEPICNVLEDPSSTNVADCMKWKVDDSCKRKSIATKTVTLRLNVPGDTIINQVNQRNERSSTLVKRIFDQEKLTEGHHDGKEHISFRHQYNCRSDPNEPIKGKLHGCFVWELN